tara:strand:+ start:428 stop:814 length:387 start_codon:yes stop_codon:yes gene_type:complete
MAAVTVRKEPKTEDEIRDEPENVTPEEEIEIDEDEDEEFTDEEFTDEESELEEGEISDADLNMEDDESLDFYDDGNPAAGIEDLAGLMTELMATPEGDTICTALVNISQQLEVQNKILIKIMSSLAKK